MRFKIFRAAILGALTLGTTHSAQTLAKPAGFTVDLKNYGWEGSGRISGSVLESATGKGLGFGRKGNVFVAFKVRVRKGLVTRDKPSFVYRVLSLDPAGKVLATTDLQTDELAENALHPIPDGVLARAGGRLYKLADDLTELAVLQPSVFKQVLDIRQVDDWSILQSATQSTVLIRGFEKLVRLNLFNLSLNTCPTAPDKPIDSISDNEAISIERDVRRGLRVYSWSLCTLGPVAEHEVSIRGIPRILPNGDFVLPSRKELRLISPQGTSRWVLAIPKKSYLATELAIQTTGERLCATLISSGGMEIFDISSHEITRRIWVVNASDGTLLSQISARAGEGYDVAIDSSGKMVAILSGSELQIHSM